MRGASSPHQKWIFAHSARSASERLGNREVSPRSLATDAGEEIAEGFALERNQILESFN
jgi:hypothetical protein